MNRALARGIGMAAVGTGAGVALSRQIARRNDERFYRSVPVDVDPIPGTDMRLPVFYNRTDGFAAVHGASLAAITELLPSTDLHPVLLAEGRAALFVGAYLYHEWVYTDASGATRPLPPYGEVMVAGLVTSRAMPPFVPLVLQSLGVGGMKGFVLHLPVTLKTAKDGGRAVWGLPKFMADMDFDDRVLSRSVRVSDEGNEILTLSVKSGGLTRTDRRPLEIYSTRGGRLLHTSVACISSSTSGMGPAGGELVIGDDHPVAKDLRRLEIDTMPVLTQFIHTQRTILPRGVDVGSARDYTGYLGSERPLGRLTMRYPGLEPFDLYADIRERVAEVAAATAERVDAPLPEPVLA